MTQKGTEELAGCSLDCVDGDGPSSMPLPSPSMPARLDPQHAEAGVGIVEGDPLDDASEHFPVGWFRSLRCGHSLFWGAEEWGEQQGRGVSKLGSIARVQSTPAGTDAWATPSDVAHAVQLGDNRLWHSLIL